jgi:hypothetical protein
MKAALAVALSIIICGCLAGGDKVQQQPHYVSSNPHLASCNNRSTVEARESCYVDAATSIGSASLCAEVGGEQLRNLCYHKVALKNLDPATCVNIKNDDVRYTDCMTSASR